MISSGIAVSPLLAQEEPEPAIVVSATNATALRDLRAVPQRTADGRDVGVVTFALASRVVTPSPYDIVVSYVVIDIERIVGATTT